MYVRKGTWLSGKALDFQPWDCEFDLPLTHITLLNGDMYWFFSGKNVLYTGHVTEPGLSCVVGFSILHYGSLTETNPLYALKPNGHVQVR